jgi:hypothetical protein
MAAASCRCASPVAGGPSIGATRARDGWHAQVRAGRGLSGADLTRRTTPRGGPWACHPEWRVVGFCRPNFCRRVHFQRHNSLVRGVCLVSGDGCWVAQVGVFASLGARRHRRLFFEGGLLPLRDPDSRRTVNRGHPRAAGIKPPRWVAQVGVLAYLGACRHKRLFCEGGLLSLRDPGSRRTVNRGHPRWRRNRGTQSMGYGRTC